MTESEAQRALLFLAFHHSVNCDWRELAETCGELRAGRLSAEDSAELLALDATVPDAKVDAQGLEGAALVLATAGRSGTAEFAASLAADRAMAVGDLGTARRSLLLALGCAATTSARLAGPKHLLRLAQVERKAGDRSTSRELAQHAYQRLDQVLLLSARLVQANVLEHLGDLDADEGRRSDAASMWTQSLELRRRFDFGTSSVTQKLAAALRR